MKKVKIRLDLDIVEAEVLKENDKTIWVRLANGTKIKRHKRKHLVEAVKGEEDEVGESCEENKQA